MLAPRSQNTLAHAEREHAFQIDEKGAERQISPFDAVDLLHPVSYDLGQLSLVRTRTMATRS